MHAEAIVENGFWFKLQTVLRSGNAMFKQRHQMGHAQRPMFRATRARDVSQDVFAFWCSIQKQDRLRLSVFVTNFDSVFRE